MRKKIAKALLWIAHWVSPENKEIVFEMSDTFKPMKLGKGYLITKKEVNDFQKKNPKFDSYNKAHAALITETKSIILGDIVRGAHKNGLVKFDVSSNGVETKVSGQLYIYAPKESIKTEEA